MKTDADPLLPLIQDGILARSTRYGRFDVFRVLLDDYMTIWLGANCLMQEKSVTSRNATPDKTACFDLYVTDEGESFYTVIEVDGDGESNYGEQHRRLFEVEGQEIISKLRERVQERELVTLSNPTVENNILVGSKVDQQLWTSIESELEGFVNSLKPIYPTMFGKGEDADTMNFFVVEPTSDNAVTVSGRCKQPAPNEVKRARQDGRVRWADNKKAIAVPVHVAGSPWIIIHFTLAKQKDNRSEAYQYYRELVPDVAEAIRRWARQQFRQRCTDAIRGAILRANSSDALVRQRVLESQLTIQLESVNRCLRGPSLKVASTQRHGSTIARVSDGRQAQVDIEIRVLSDQHQAEINLSDVESEDKLRAHMEQAANAVVAEISARSSEEAAVSAHILRTHIGEIRSLALDRGTQLEENIYRLALQMEHYLSATRMIFRGDAKVDESIKVHSLFTDIPGVTSETSIEWSEAINQNSQLKRSKDFLLIAIETCSCNSRDHGGSAMKIRLQRQGDVIFASIENGLIESKVSGLRAKLPSLNANSSGYLGIRTLHLACDAWFKVAPHFDMIELHDQTWFTVTFPVARL